MSSTLFGRRRDLTSNHDVLLAPAELYVDPGREPLVFRHENQGSASWGILLSGYFAEFPAVEVTLPWGGPEPERKARTIRLILTTRYGNAVRANYFSAQVWKPGAGSR
ncbi:hypothetical protein [Streptomyces violascens]|uniref:hypothetical protein n=1 Tax=Streptomyces violascens TaxID=67381 RepID=UPI00368079F0